MSPDAANVPYTPSPLCPHTHTHTHKETKGTSIYRDTRARGQPDSPPIDHGTATKRVDINERLPPSPADDPSCLAFGRALRARFGMGVKIYPDRYAGLWP